MHTEFFHGLSNPFFQSAYVVIKLYLNDCILHIDIALIVNPFLNFFDYFSVGLGKLTHPHAPVSIII